MSVDLPTDNRRDSSSGLPQTLLPDGIALPVALPEDTCATYDPEKGGSSFIQTIDLSEVSRPQTSSSLTRWRLSTDPDAGEGGDPPDYRMIKVVGQGGFGEVWSAEQNSLGRHVAIKRLRADLRARLKQECDETRARLLEENFRLEGRTTAALDHPNIVSVHDLGADRDGNPLLAMKLVSGTLWTDLIRADARSMTTGEHLAKHIPILAAVGQAVAFAHARGIVHRDLKPSQVIVGEFGEVTLMDWGLAIQVGRTDENGPVVAPTPSTASGPAGTVAYMAPEQTESHARGVGEWTDVYLLGGVLYYLLTLSTPHPGGNIAAFAMAASGVYRPLSQAAKGREIPAELAALCERALQPDPHDRVESAAAFVQALQDFTTGANRRREAAQILNQVKLGLFSGENGYRDATQSLSRLDQAARLDPDNAQITVLSREVSQHLVGQALESGDLALARTEAERLPESAARRELLGRVEAAEAQQKSREMQRRLALAAAAVFLVALLGFGGVYTVQMREKNDEITTALDEVREQRDIAGQLANVARNRAEASADLTRFMIEDLAKTLDMKLERDRAIAARFSEKVANHYENIPDWPADPEAAEALVQEMSDTLTSLLRFERMDEAQRVYDRLEELVLAVYSDGDRQRIRLLEFRAALFAARGDKQSALEMREEALRQIKAAPGATRLDVITQTLNTIDSKWEFDTSIELIDEMRATLEELERDFPEEEALIRVNRGRLGQALGDRGLYEEASNRLLAYMADELNNEDGDILMLSYVTGSYASLLLQSRRYLEAEPFLLESIHLCETTLGPDSIHTHTVKIALGTLYTYTGRFDQAEEILLAAGPVFLGYYGPNHLDYAAYLSQLAALYANRREIDKALPITLDIARIHEANAHSGPDRLSRSYINAAIMHAQAGETLVAEEYFERWYELLENSPVEINATERANALMNYGVFLQKQGQVELSGQMMEQARTIGVENFGPDSPFIAAVDRNLAVVYIQTDRLDDALRTAASAEAAIAKSSGRENPTWAGAREVLADVQMRLGEYQPAYDGYLEVCAYFQSAADDQPDNPEWTRRLSAALGRAAELALLLGRDGEAADLSARLGDLLPPASDALDEEALLDLAERAVVDGVLLANQGDIDGARRTWEEALESLASLEVEEGESRRLLGARGTLLTQLGREGEAEAAWGALAERDKSLAGLRRDRAERLRAGWR